MSQVGVRIQAVKQDSSVNPQSHSAKATIQPDELIELLADAQGVSEFVIAVSIDIRGFSTYSGQVDSVEAAAFLKRVYTKMLRECFRGATMAKLTGDGLFLVFPFPDDEKTFRSLAKRLLKASVELVDQFGGLTRNDILIGAPTPPNIGVGIASGPATRLQSGGTILDYSGRTLNIAARLNNLARPRGVVVASDLATRGLTTAQNKLFQETSVFLRGTNETVPIAVRYQHDLVVIPEASHRPVGERWRLVEVEYTVAEIKRTSVPILTYDLEGEPDGGATGISVELEIPEVIGGKETKSVIAVQDIPAELDAKGGRFSADLRRDDLVRYLTESKARLKDRVTVRLRYKLR